MTKKDNIYDVVVVGCGISGMVVSRKLADNGYKVLILDRRNHIGGNIYDHVNQDGFLIQDYGPHSFFTDDERIRPFVEEFIETEDSYLKYRTCINGMMIPMPFNFTSIDMLYGKMGGQIA